MKQVIVEGHRQNPRSQMYQEEIKKLIRCKGTAVETVATRRLPETTPHMKRVRLDAKEKREGHSDTDDNPFRFPEDQVDPQVWHHHRTKGSTPRLQHT